MDVKLFTQPTPIPFTSGGPGIAISTIGYTEYFTHTVSTSCPIPLCLLM